MGDVLKMIEYCENSVQSCWTLNVPGTNLSSEHEIFTYRYMYWIFKELNSDLFEFEDIVRPGPDKTYDVNKMLPFIGWAHYHNVSSCRKMEELWKHNIEAVDFILNCTKPSKSTISAFLIEYEDLIESFDKFIKKFSINLGLIEGNSFYWEWYFHQSILQQLQKDVSHPN